MKADGGPAFPWSMWDRDSIGEPVVREVYGGMSLREWYAGQALAGYCANPDALAGMAAVSEGVETDADLHDAIARLMYEHADAMLRARSAAEEETSPETPEIEAEEEAT